MLFLKLNFLNFESSIKDGSVFWLAAVWICQERTRFFHNWYNHGQHFSLVKCEFAASKYFLVTLLKRYIKTLQKGFNLNEAIYYLDNLEVSTDDSDNEDKSNL